MFLIKRYTVGRSDGAELSSNLIQF